MRKEFETLLYLIITLNLIAFEFHLHIVYEFPGCSTYDRLHWLNNKS